MALSTVEPLGVHTEGTGAEVGLGVDGGVASEATDNLLPSAGSYGSYGGIGPTGDWSGSSGRGNLPDGSGPLGVFIGDGPAMLLTPVISLNTAGEACWFWSTALGVSGSLKIAKAGESTNGDASVRDARFFLSLRIFGVRLDEGRLKLKIGRAHV